jgi:hypothetical protein
MPSQIKRILTVDNDEDESTCPRLHVGACWLPFDDYVEWSRGSWTSGVARILTDSGE